MVDFTICNASQVANFILHKAKHENRSITPLKLLKLTYLSYGWVRALLDKSLFEEEIEAWRLGPVIPSLYHEFKIYGSSPILNCSINMDENGQTSDVPPIPGNHPALPIIEKAWNVYKHFTASALVNKTHEPDSPWAKHYQFSAPKIVIPDEEIKEYFIKKLKEYINASRQ